MSNANPAIEVVRSNRHATLPAYLQGLEYLVIAKDGDDIAVITAFDDRQDAMAVAGREYRQNKRMGRVHYASGFYLLQADGSWRVQ